MKSPKRMGGYYWITLKGKDELPQPALYNAEKGLWARIGSIRWVQEKEVASVAPLLCVIKGGKE